MANTAQGGFRFRRMRNGGTRQPIEVAFVATSYSTALYKGDPVKRVADGSVELAAEGDTDTYAIVQGVKQYWDGTAMRSGNYLPATTVWGTNLARQSELYVTPVTDAIFEVDCDDAVTFTTEATAQALIGGNVDMQAGVVTASTNTGISGYGVDISTITNGAANCRVVGLSKRPDNDFASINAKIEIQFNESSQPPATTSGI